MSRGTMGLATGALLALSSACAEGGGITGLDETFDAKATLAVLEDMSGAGEGIVSAAHVPLAADVLAEAVAAGTSPVVAPRLAGGPLDRPAGWGFAPRGDASDAPGSGGPALAPAAAALAGGGAALVPDTLEGRTFALRQIGGYALVEGVGGPAGGVRFLTYELDPLTGRPRTVPLNRAGHLDIVEASATRLELRGVRGTGGGARPDLDLFLVGSFSLSEAGLSSDFASTGSLLAGRDVEFSAEEHVELTSSRLEILVARRIEVPASGRFVSVDWEGTATSTEVTETLDLAVGDGGHAAVLELAATATSVAGTLAYDGVTVAVLSGDPLDPTFTRPDGSAFSPAELDGLLALLDGASEALAFGDEMLFPLAFLFEG